MKPYPLSAEKPATDVRHRTAPTAPIAPGPHYYTPFGLLSDMRQGILQFYLNTQQFGDVVRFQFGPWPSHVLFHPDHVKYVLQDNQQNYRRSVFIEGTKVAFGDGLFTSEGAYWHQQRRLLQAGFQRHKLALLMPQIQDSVSGMLERWQSFVDDGRRLDILTEMNRLVVEIGGKTILGIDLGQAVDEVGHALTHLRHHFSYRFASFFAPPETIPTLQNYRFWQAVRVVDRIAYRTIAQRRSSKQTGTDVLSILLQAQQEGQHHASGIRLSDKQLRDEIIIFLFGTVETMVGTLAWIWYLLSHHPEVSRRLRREVTHVLNGRLPAAQDLFQLSYTRMVIQEVLRLYPPVWVMSRNTIGNDEIGGYHIPANSPVMLSPYVTHRHPAWWHNPSKFAPERFDTDQSAERPRYAYFPFGGGLRHCIGSEFAILEAQLIVAMVAQRYHVQCIQDTPVHPDPMLALRPQTAIPMRLSPV